MTAAGMQASWIAARMLPGKRGVIHRPYACSFRRTHKETAVQLEARGGRKSALKGRGLRQ
jgi:hypothetical protein